MVVDVVNRIVIDRPIDEVASYVSNPDNAPAWYVNIKSVEWVSEPPLRVGSLMAFVAQFMGKRLAYTYEVVEWLEEERFVMRTAKGPFPMETTYSWQPIEAGQTRMTLRNCGIPAGFSKFLAPLMKPAINRANRKDLALLKQILEARV